MERASRLKWLQVIFLSALVFCALGTFLYAQTHQSFATKPIDGLLDLSEWQYNQERVSLAGQWEFYWNKFYTYKDFQSGQADEKTLVAVPHTWNKVQHSGKAVGGTGYGTYRLKVKVKDISKPISLRIDTISTAYRLFVDNEYLIECGKVGERYLSSQPGYQPQIVTFTPKKENFELILHVSNFEYARGGIWYEINLGSPEQIQALDKIIVYKDALLIGSLMMMAMYYLSFTLILKRDFSSLYFMLLCLTFIVRTSLYGDILIKTIFPDLNYKIIIFLTYATLYWIPILIFMLADSIFKPIWTRKIRLFCLSYGITATLATLVLPIKIYTSLITPIEVIGIGMVLLAIGVIAEAFNRGESGAKILLVTIYGVLLAGIHDVAYQANVIHHTFGELAPVSIFSLTLSFSIIIANQLSLAYQNERILTGQLEDALKNEQLANEEKIKTELAFLKAQIKPHFLYNSLSIITALSTKDPQKTKELLYNFSDYLRGSFDFDHYKDLSTLESELNTLKAYLAIEQVRFQGRLSVVYDLDESIEASLPILTIQPLVENALRHGLLKKSAGGTIKIHTFSEGEFNYVKIEDDGIGMSAMQVDQILSMTQKERGVGLRNINQRLCLLYGYGLVIESEKDRGTIVTIKIPKRGSVKNA